LLGREGWLFFSAEQMMEHWTREAVWTEQDLENWRRLLEMRRDWLRERGCKYLLVVPPDKHSVYPEYLPGWMKKSAKPSKVQQLVQYMKAHSTVEVLDLTDVLIAAKKTRVDYLQTDTHWNLFGGFVAYRVVVEALARQLPGLEPLPLDAYRWKPKAQPAGDCAILLGRVDSYKETQAVSPESLKPLPTVSIRSDPVRFPRRQTNEVETCFTLNEQASGKAIIFRDSFATSWRPLLGLHFKEVIYLWHYDWDRPLIEREKPDVVIDEILERRINLLDPVELARQDQSSVTNTPGVINTSLPAPDPESRPAH
jgi:hypothetical protein